MGEVLTDIVEWMSSLPVLWAYVSILLVAYGENVMPPIPGDMVIVFGGYMVGIDRLDLIPVIFLSTAGGSFGFMTMYVFGGRIGRRLSKSGVSKSRVSKSGDSNGKDSESSVLKAGLLRWISQDRIERARDMLARWGNGLILANRFLPGLRSVISITVGMAEKPAPQTMAYATVSALVWSVLLVGLGYGFGENWEQVSSYLKTYGTVVFALIIGFVVIQLILSRRRRRNTWNEVKKGIEDVNNPDE